MTVGLQCEWRHLISHQDKDILLCVKAHERGRLESEDFHAIDARRRGMYASCASASLLPLTNAL
jgi:hypothetical protein